MEIVNDRLDQTSMRNAEAAFKAAQARVAAANERLEVLRLAEEKRRDVMLRTSPVERTRDAESEIGRVGAELGAARASEREGLQGPDDGTRGLSGEAEGGGEGAARRDPLQASSSAACWWRRAIRSRGGSIATSCWSMRRSSTRGCGLLAVGGKGQVMLEGEDIWRDGEIIALHRSGDAVDARELATVAGGRDRGAGQVLLKLAATSGDFDRCPVGRAAYVRLPDLDLLARLGLR